MSAAAAGDPVIYEIESQEIDATPIGCTNCPSYKQQTPSLKPSAAVGISGIANASKIDSFSTSNWDQESQAQKTYEGGCAIVSGGLKCWGGNNYGQLGDETATTSTTPVVAKDGGVALTGVSDVVANGTTTCIIQSGALKCVGMGNWSGLTFERLQTNINTWTKSTGQWTNATGNYKNNVLKDGVVVKSTSTSTWQNTSLYSPTWITLLASGVSKVQLGANANTSTPTMCVMKTDGVAQCAVVTIGKETGANLPRAFDCDGDVTNGTDAGGFESAGDGSYERTFRSKDIYKTSTTAATWAWTDAGLTGVTDISMSAESWGSNNLCVAASGVAVCRTFSGGVFGTKVEIDGSEAATDVYVMSGFGPPGLCLYASGTMKCGAGTSGPTGQTGATKVVPVAVMEKPLAIFYGSVTTMSKLFFVLPSGILSADSWIFNCSGCQTNSANVVTPVSAFTAATGTSYFNLTSVTGATDNMKYIPVTVQTGTRRTRSLVSFTVKTQSGELLTATSVRWTAPDAPGTLGSSSSSTLVTDATGTGRVTVTTGPVMFTLTNGTMASGATLQAANITAIVAETGSIDIVVPDPPAVVKRTISVVLPDASPVPSATVVMKNNYLMYGYSNTGSSTSSWASRPKDSNNYLGTMSCSYCFVAPPVYITGADGSVTFPSFNLPIRSTSYDANVSYDDGELNQTVKSTFTSLAQTVSMPFMAKVKITVADADPSTPKTTEVIPAADGSVEIPVEIVDEDKKGISDITVSTEEVCEQAKTGGIWTSAKKVENICTTTPTIGGPTSTIPGSIVKTSSVRAAGVSAAATCTSDNTVKTNSAGKGTVKICFSASKEVRIRSKGVLASAPFCVVVGGIPCGATTVTKITSIKMGKSLSVSKVKAMVKLNAKAGKTVKYKASGACTLKGSTVVAAKKKGTCKVTVIQAAKGKYKGVTKTLSFKIL